MEHKDRACNDNKLIYTPKQSEITPNARLVIHNFMKKTYLIKIYIEKSEECERFQFYLQYFF